MVIQNFCEVSSWILTVSNPQPKALWQLSSNAMILILKANRFKFPCNRLMISFTDLKMLKPGATLTVISIYVTYKRENFSNQLYARHKENASIHWKYFLSLEAIYHSLLIKYQKLQRTNIVFSRSISIEQDYWKHTRICLPMAYHNQSVPFTSSYYCEELCCYWLKCSFWPLNAAIQKLLLI